MRIVLDDALYFGCSYIEKGPDFIAPPTGQRLFKIQIVLDVKKASIAIRGY